MSFTVNIPGGNVQLSGNPIWIDVSSTTSGMTNHNILLRVTSTDGNIPGGPFIDSISGSPAAFNISGLIDVNFDYLFNTRTDQSIKTWDGLVANITIEAGESYYDTNGDYQEVWSGSTTALSIIKGKLTKTELVSLDENGSSFFDKYITNHIWLTPSVCKYSGSDQVYFRVNNPAHPVKIWTLYRSQETISLMWNIAYTDGSSPLGFIDIILTKATTLLEIDAHSIIANNADTAKTIEHYNIQMGGGRNVRVDVTNVHSENHTELYILNRFGAVECVNCYGEKQEAGNTESDMFTKQQGRTLSVYDRTIYQEQQTARKTYKINTGYKTLTERRWIADLLRSPYKQAWLKVEDSPTPVPYETFGIEPVTITTSSFDVDTTTKDLQAIEIEIEVAHND